MTFRFSAGYGVQAVVVDTAFVLNDDKWHTVYAERNRIEAILRVDEFAPVGTLDLYYAKLSQLRNLCLKPFLSSVDKTQSS